MAQSAGAVPKSKLQVQLSINGSSWAEKVGVVKVTPGGGEQLSGSQNTADGAAPVVTAGGKTTMETVELTGLYTKVTGELWDYLRDRFEGTDKTIYMRWAPEGGIGTVVGNEQFLLADDGGTAFPAVIKRCSAPESDAGDGAPALVSALLECPKILRGLTTTA